MPDGCQAEAMTWTCEHGISFLFSPHGSLTVGREDSFWVEADPDFSSHITSSSRELRGVLTLCIKKVKTHLRERLTLSKNNNNNK